MHCKGFPSPGNINMKLASNYPQTAKWKNTAYPRKKPVFNRPCLKQFHKVKLCPDNHDGFEKSIKQDLRNTDVEQLNRKMMFI
jgi:hypothetical protein